MVLKILRVSDVVGMKIFTDSGDYLGMVEEANVVGNKVDSWRVKIARDSNLSALLSGARGLIIPHQYVKAISEVLIISRSAIPVREEMKEAGEATLLE
ncbi:MAG: PRC-barrel domain-containing protein [Candidatus Pacearchaeota archaeon]|nr:MAG: PRC-barrel domain-containing protein [Candidatus Pacearchaeota archaeon]